MQLAIGIRHLLAGSLAFLLVIGLSATFWAITGRDSLLLRDDNPRKYEALAAIQRGSIYDRVGQLLAETVPQPAAMQRHYPRPSANSAVGYFSLRYGASGAEAAYDDLLSATGEVMSLQYYVDRNLLRMPQIGSDIRLSIDAGLQDALTDALRGERGAAVVLNAWSGETIALVSLPSFNPNSLDEDWEELVAADGKPFFNRALQGNYQLGGAMYTVLLAEAIRSQFDMTQRFPQAGETVVFNDGVTISCVIAPNSPELTLVDAYAFGCPAPFQAFFVAAPQFELDAALQRFAFYNPIVLDGYPQPEPTDMPRSTAAEQLKDEDLEPRAAHGQGNLTATPLHMAAVMAAVATDGRIRMPTILSATRAPGARRWQSAAVTSSSKSIVSVEEAHELREIMRRSWSTLRNDSAGGDVGAQIARSQSGDEARLWFKGFAVDAGGRLFAFAIVLENSGDPSKLLSIAQTIIQALALL